MFAVCMKPQTTTGKKNVCNANLQCASMHASRGQPELGHADKTDHAITKMLRVSRFTSILQYSIFSTYLFLDVVCLDKFCMYERP